MLGKRAPPEYVFEAGTIMKTRIDTCIIVNALVLLRSLSRGS